MNAVLDGIFASEEAGAFVTVSPGSRCCTRRLRSWKWAKSGLQLLIAQSPLDDLTGFRFDRVRLEYALRHVQTDHCRHGNLLGQTDTASCTKALGAPSSVHRRFLMAASPSELHLHGNDGSVADRSGSRRNVTRNAGAASQLACRRQRSFPRLGWWFRELWSGWRNRCPDGDMP